MNKQALLFKIFYINIISSTLSVYHQVLSLIPIYSV